MMYKLILSGVLSSMISVTAIMAQNTFPQTGNVGIGTTSPTEALQVNGNINLNSFGQLKSNRLYWQSTPSASAANARGIIGNNLIWDNDNGKWKVPSGGSSIDFGIIRFQASGHISFFTRPIPSATPTDPVDAFTDITDADLERYRRMTVTNTGNVGIGTGAPTTKLDVNGSGNFSGSITSTRADITGGFISLINTGKTAAGTAKIWNIMNMTGSYGNSLQFWAYDNTGCPGGMCTNRFTITDDGNVGIGTATPADALHVIGAISAKNSASATNNGITINAGTSNTPASVNTNRLRFGGNDGNSNYFTIQGPSNTDVLTINNGNVGIGTTTPGQKLSVNGTIDATNIQSSYITKTLADNFTYDGQSFGHYAFGWKADSWEASGPTAWLTAYGGIKLMTKGEARLSVTSNGNVGIGTTNPGQFKLAVEGTIGARKVRVTTDAWADYVFEKDYHLLPLEKLQDFINQNKHLPGVPSAKEVAQKGVDVGDTQVLLLKKIEELTLYIMQLNKRIEKLEGKNNASINK